MGNEKVMVKRNLCIVRRVYSHVIRVLELYIVLSKFWRVLHSFIMYDKRCYAAMPIAYTAFCTAEYCTKYMYSPRDNSIKWAKKTNRTTN